MVMSILHRASGLVLAVGAFGLAWWLNAVAAGGETQAQASALLGSLPGRLVLAVFAACLVYHLLNGIRHLLWDVGYGYEIPKVYATGWTVAVTALVLTAGLWVLIARAGGAA